MLNVPTEKFVNIDSVICRTEKQAAEILGTKVKTLQAWRLRGYGPKFIKVGRSVRYRLCDLIAFQEQQLRTSTSAIN